MATDQEIKELYNSLTPKQKLFCKHYLTTLNATEAARKAGYKGGESVLGVTGWENLRKPKIKTYIDHYLNFQHMPESEVLARITEIARVNIGDFITDRGEINWSEVKKRGHLIKTIRQTKEGYTLTLYDGQKAVVDMGRHYKLFTDTIEHTGDLLADSQMTGEAVVKAAGSILDAISKSDPDST